MHGGGGSYGDWGSNYMPPAMQQQQPFPDYSNLYTPGAPPYASPPPPPPPPAPMLPMTHTPTVASPYDFPLSSYAPPPSAAQEQQHIADPNAEPLFNSNSSYYAPAVPSYNYDNGGIMIQGSPGYGAVAPPFVSYDQQQAGSPAAYAQQGGLGIAPAYMPEGSLGSLRMGGAAAYESVQGFGAGSQQGMGEVYLYDGGQQAPRQGFESTHGAPPLSSSWNSGRSDAGSFGSFNDPSSGGSKVARATPKQDTYDTGGGVQKYRVKMLPDSMDVICQIGLDGVKMLDPSTSRTLRIYPLETIARWEVTEPSVFTFWAKSAVDIELRTIRLKSSTYTTNAILDTITAACVQLSEMVGKDGPGKASTSTSTVVTSPGVQQRKGSIVDWVSIRPRAVTQEEKQHWVPDEAATKCRNCNTVFSAFNRRHHCRNCGDVFCDSCTRGRTTLTAEPDAEVVRVCDRCLAEVTQRLTNAKDMSNKVPVLRTHEDLAKTLQNLGPQSWSNSSAPTQGSNTKMREVACPTCTVHLQVQVPSFGTETVECGVCQHPFLVSAN
ncbi:unnamed protein product [Sphagnum compactum]